jgi:hypothetical protein
LNIIVAGDPLLATLRLGVFWNNILGIMLVCGTISLAFFWMAEL